MQRVLVYRRKFLPKSETFIYEQLIGHKRVQTAVLARQKHFNRKQFPYSPVYVKKRFKGLAQWLKKEIRLFARQVRSGWSGNTSLCPQGKAAVDHLLSRLRCNEARQGKQLLPPSIKKAVSQRNSFYRRQRPYEKTSRSARLSETQDHIDSLRH